MDALLAIAVIFAIAALIAAVQAHKERDAARARLTAERGRNEELEAEIGTERRARGLVEQARRSEHEWVQQLRGQVMQLQRAQGPLGDPSDTPALVLRVALNLLEADRGMLLSRVDADGDGRLDVARSEGYDDPEASDLAQSLADRVLERDETLRLDRAIAIPIYIHDSFDGVLVAEGREGGFEELDDEVLLALGDHAGAILHNARLRGELRGAYLDTVATLSDALTAKDPDLGGHSADVARYVAAVAERLDVEPDRRESLVFASLLHDVGKIGISERILLKPGPLTAEERAIVELHPRIGFKLVERVAALEDLALAVLHHHERYDGTGYPSRLRGEHIPLEARIVGVADAFSAMVADRPYRPALSVAEACDELVAGAGSQFDPAVVEAFLDEVRRRPPNGSVSRTLNDPELAQHRTDGEIVLGADIAGLIDATTGLYSRRHLEETVRAEARRAAVQDRPFSVVLVELSELGTINRVQGPAAGDEALREAARVLQGAAIGAHGTACRHAGRRFAVVLPHAGAEHAKRVADRIVEMLPERFGVRVTCTTCTPGEDGEALLDRARATLPAA